MKKHQIIILCSIIVVGIIILLTVILGVRYKDKSSIKNEVTIISSSLDKLTKINSTLISADADFINGIIDKDKLLTICAKTEVDINEIENSCNASNIKDEDLKDIMFNVSNLTTNMIKIISYSKELSKDRYNGYADKLTYENDLFSNNLIKIKEKVASLVNESK
jgi:hypothetical protein